MKSKPITTNNIVVHIKRKVEQTDEQKKLEAIEKIKLLSERLNSAGDK